MNMLTHGKDWCHLCGTRYFLLLDIFYSINSENEPKDESQYIRICAHCLSVGNQMLRNFLENKKPSNDMERTELKK